jgi:hypothetical protein
MKKIGFALQVFALITILPLYLIPDMSHATVASTNNNTVLKITEKVKVISTDYPPTPEYKMEIPCLLISIKALY